MSDREEEEEEQKIPLLILLIADHLQVDSSEKYCEIWSACPTWGKRALP